jgi:hypothetical protein
MRGLVGRLPILGNNELKNENKVLGVIVAIRVVCEEMRGNAGSLRGIRGVDVIIG